MNRMKISVITDVVLLERGNDIAPAALFEHARLFADELERRANAALGEHFGQALRRVVVGGQKIIFSVEPEDDVDNRLVGCGCQAEWKQYEQRGEEERSSDEGFHGRNL